MPKVTNRPARGGHRGDAQRAVQRVDVGDGMVGGEHPQQAVRVVLGGQQRGRGDGGGAVAADRFQHQAGVGDAGGAQLLRDQEAVLVVADDDRRGEAGAAGAQRGFLHQACDRRSAAKAAWGSSRARPATAGCRSRRTG